MIGILEDIWSFVTSVPDLLLWAGESVVNVVGGAFDAVFVAAVAVLPALPEPLEPPTDVQYVNWLFPVGAAATVAAGLLAGYVTFLSIRWILKKAGAM